MLYLPILRSDSGGFRLPLAEATAANLISAVTTTDAGQRRTRLLFGIRRDPALALWAVSHAWIAANQTLRHLHAIAIWLADQGLNELFAATEESRVVGISEILAEQTEIRVTAAADWPSFHQLGCRGVAIANWIEAGLAASSPKLDPQRDPQLLLALLVDASAWLAVAASPPTPIIEQRITDWLPSELAESVRQFTPTPEQRLNETTQSICDSAWSCESQLDTRPRAASARQLVGPVLTQAQRLNQLQIEFQERLEQAKLHAMKELAYGASHEINNPLANISTRAQTLLREEYDPERRRALVNINRQAFRAHEMIADMMLFANPPRIKRQNVNLQEIVREALDELRSMADQRGVRMIQGTQDAGFVSIDPVQMAVAIKAICQNAIESMPHSGTLNVSSVRTKASPSMAVITISDSGCGLSSEVRKHLFEPFFSGREAGRGLGFGLSKAWRIVTDHQGQIEVDSRQDIGTTVKLHLPIIASSEKSSCVG